MIQRSNVIFTIVLSIILCSASFTGSVSGQVKGHSSAEKRILPPDPIVLGVAATAPSLGIASSFAVLGATTVTNAGPSILTGNLGVSPGTSITGFPPGLLLGDMFAGGAVPVQAQADVALAFTDLNDQTCTKDLTGQDLGGLTVFPGVNCFAVSAPFTGVLTLDALGDPDAVFIFKIGSTLLAGSNSTVTLVNGATACNTFFSVGSSATLEANSHLEGNLLALVSITLAAGASANGLVAAQSGAVTMDTNDVSTCAVLPTAAAHATVGGRVLSSTGRGLQGTLVQLIDSQGVVRSTYSSTFGYYSFAEVEVGQSLVVSVLSRRYTFAEPMRVVPLADEIADLNFVAN